MVIGGADEIGPAATVGRTDQVFDLKPEPEGYWSGECYCPPGSRYRFLLDDRGLFPDPASRYQPLGPHGPSEVIDPSSFRWSDRRWEGLNPRRQVLYEMHIGTFTKKGTWRAATRELAKVRALGATSLQVMPVADFPGRFGWGYDGVDLFAPTRLYGRPDDFRKFVDKAHSLGLGVILDVVYNHIGPEGNYLREFSSAYETDRYYTEWGQAINFDGPDSGPVREFFLTNALYWLREFHVDGFRLDATHRIFDHSGRHILGAISAAAREAVTRPLLFVAEHEAEDAVALAPVEEGGWGCDLLLSEGFHHSAMVALTGHGSGYYSGFQGRPHEFVSVAKRSLLYQGERNVGLREPWGTPTGGIARRRFAVFLQNHDQVAASANGERLHRLTSPGRYRAITALFLLLPQTPLLFQGQEFACSSPFLYFADHEPEAAALVRSGRRAFLAKLPALVTAEMIDRLPDPSSERTFRASKIRQGERGKHGKTVALHADLLTLRGSDPVFGSGEEVELDGAVLAEAAFVLRFSLPSQGGRRSEVPERLLLVNLGRDARLEPAPEPLLAPPIRRSWSLLWSSENPRYGGSGTPPVEKDGRWFLPGEAAVVLAAVPGTGR